MENATSVLIVVPPEAQLAVEIQLDENWVHRNVTMAKYALHEGASSSDLYDVIEERDSNVSVSDAARFRLRSLGWSSLVLQGEGLEAAGTSWGRGLVASGGQPIHAYGAHRSWPLGTHLEAASPRADGFLLAAEPAARGLMPVNVNATQLTGIQWHNMTIECHAGPCPDGARGFVERREVLTGSLTIVHQPHALITSSGAAAGGGHAWVMFASGAQATLRVDGTLRLPLAECESRCPDWSGEFTDQTLTLQGTTHLQAFRRSDEMRAAADVTGTWDAAYLDESQTYRVDSQQIVKAGLGLALAALLAKVFAALYSRVLRPEDDPEARRLVEQVVTEDPGARFREIMRATGLANGQVSHHLRRLEEQVRVKVYVRGRRRHFFPADAHWAHRWKPAVALRDVHALHVFHTIHAHPGLSQTDLVDFYGQQGWSRTRIQRKLQLLTWADLVARDIDSRRVCYSATSQAETLGALGMADILDVEQAARAPEQRQGALA